MIDPKSTAGVLLREFHNPQAAYEYAQKKAIALTAMGNALGLDYWTAADEIGDLLFKDTNDNEERAHA